MCNFTVPDQNQGSYSQPQKITLHGTMNRHCKTIVVIIFGYLLWGSVSFLKQYFKKYLSKNKLFNIQHLNIISFQAVFPLLTHKLFQTSKHQPSEAYTVPPFSIISTTIGCVIWGTLFWIVNSPPYPFFIDFYSL